MTPICGGQAEDDVNACSVGKPTRKQVFSAVARSVTQ
jgi:hypothetical protein